MLAGYNQAWFLPLSSAAHYHHDLAEDFDPAGVEVTFQCLRQAGSHVVRLWLCEGNNQLPEGVEFSGGLAQGLQPAMLANVRTVMDLARAHGVQVYWTLLAPNTGYNPLAKNPKDRAVQPFYQDLYGRIFDPIRHPYEAVGFIENVLLPLVDMLQPYAAEVYAIDLVNELDWVVNTYLANPQWRFEPITAWLDTAARLVKMTFTDPPRLGVSFGNEWLQYPLLYHVQEAGVNLDFFDIHAYHDTGKLALRPDEPIQKPLILGEYGHRSPKAPRPDEDTRQAQATEAFLAQAAAQGCEAAFAWRLLDDYHSHWSHFDLSRQGSQLCIGQLKPAAQVIATHNAAGSINAPV